MPIELICNNNCNCKVIYEEEMCEIFDNDFFDDEDREKFNVNTESEEFVDRASTSNCKEEICKFTIADFFIQILDNLIATILIPFFIWQRISASEFLKKIIKTTLEVILELIIMSILAGVSILTTIFLLIDDSDSNSSKNNFLNQQKEQPNVLTINK